MSTVARALALLGAFSAEQPVWAADELAAALGLSRATAYRYVKDLVEAGLLQRLDQGRLALGARIAELDFQLRGSDPVLRAAQPVMRTLARRTGLDAVLSVMFGGPRVVDTHRESASGALTLRYGRGRPRPLFRGAAPKVLLAALPVAAQRRLHERQRAEVDSAGMGTDWPAFRARLLEIAAAGGYLSRGELDRGVSALAVPVRDGAGTVLAALALVGRSAAFRSADMSSLRGRLDRAAELVARELG